MSKAKQTKTKLRVRYCSGCDIHQVFDGKKWEQVDYLDMSALEHVAGVVGFKVVDDDDVEICGLNGCEQEEE